MLTKVKLLNEAGGSDLSFFSQLEEIVLILGVTRFDVKEHFLFIFSILCEMVVHIDKILLEFAEVIMLLAKEDEDVSK